MYFDDQPGMIVVSGKALNKAANADETTPRAKKAAKNLMGAWKKKIDYKPSSGDHFTG